MNPSQFLQTVLPTLPPIATAYTERNGYVVFALKPDDRPVQRPAYRCDDVYDLGKGYSNIGYNAYFALGAFHNNHQGRKAADAYAFKSVWADIDVGKASATFQTLKEALTHLYDFVKRTQLIPTYIVKSGKGLHVYWAFTANVPASTWQVVARCFHCVCTKHNLQVDPARAEDAASVLRIPGTLHQKSGETVQILGRQMIVWELPKFMKQMGMLVTPAELRAFQSSSRKAQGEARAVSAEEEAAMRAEGILSDEDLHDPLPIIRGCAQIKRMGFASEPAWFRAMSVLRMCRNGRQVAHTLSALDKARYDRQQCDAKFYAALYDHPCTCDSFAQVNPAMCAGCKHRGQIKSPAQLDRITTVVPVTIEKKEPVAVVETVESKTAPVVEPVGEQSNEPMLVQGNPLPSPLLERNVQLQCEPKTIQNNPMFSVDSGGIFYNAQGTDPVTGQATFTKTLMSKSQLYYLYGTTQIVDRRPHRCHVFKTVMPSGRVDEVLFDVERDYSAQAIMKWFANANIFPTPSCNKPSLFMSFMNAYLASIAPEGVATELDVCDKFGWSQWRDPKDDSKVPGFVMGDGVITYQGIKPVSFDQRIEKDASETFVAKGSLAMWKRISNMYARLHQPAGMLAVCLSFAAPLMRYALGEANSAVFSLWSDASGKGKTGVLRMAASVWGNPYNQFISRDASSVARTRKLTYLNNLPAFMDEMTDVSDEDMYGLAYTLTGGKEKDKLKSSGDAFVSTGNWSTVSFMTANRSVREAIARKAGTSEATLLRVMEYECDFRSYEDKPEVNRYISTALEALKVNYGLAGPEFMYRLLQRPERLQTLSSRLEHWISQNHFTNNERFISNALGLALIAGQWAVEFGLLDYDMDALEAWVLEHFMTENRSVVKDFAESGRDLLSDFIALNSNSMFVVTAKKRPKGFEDPGRSDVGDKYVMSMPRSGVAKMRYCVEEGVLYILSTSLKEYLKSRNTTLNNLQKILEKKGVQLGFDRVALFGGCSYLSSARSICVVVDAASMRKLGLSLDETVMENQKTERSVSCGK